MLMTAGGVDDGEEGLCGVDDGGGTAVRYG